MIYSSYQVERLIDRLRQLGDWLPWPAYQRWRGMDRVRIRRAAAEAARAARGEPGGPRRRAPPSVAAVRAGRRYAPLVEEEQERRAGSFMQPPYPDDAPAQRIPRVSREARRRRSAPVGEGD
jgi:hypothetical protein